MLPYFGKGLLPAIAVFPGFELYGIIGLMNNRDIVRTSEQIADVLAVRGDRFPSRGYGFIACGAGEGIFFHKAHSLAEPTALQKGQRLHYGVEERNTGQEETDVERYVDGPETSD